MKKKLLIVMAGIGLAVGVNGQTLYIPSGTSGIGTSTNGNVGIGTATPTSLWSQTLQVYNSNNADLSVKTDHNEWHMASDGSGNLFFTETPSYIRRLFLQTGGNVGIGTVSPGGGLEIFKGNTNDYSLILNSSGSGWGSGMLFKNTAGTEYGIYSGADGKWHFANNNKGIDNILIDNNGNVGIGTTTPVYKLDVNGTIHTSNGRIIIDGGSDTELLNINGAGHSGIVIKSNGNYKGYLWYSADVDAFLVGPGNVGNNIAFKNNNVLIGKTTQTNTTYKLDVAGKIRADEITVNTTGADFVFAPTYKLRTLAEVETFIKANKHLPDIAPAANMQTNGVSMGEMQAKLLQKVEELTLYSIEQDKKLQGQNEKLQRQEQEIKELKELVMKKLK